MRESTCPYVFDCKLGLAYKCPTDRECEMKLYYEDVDRRLQLARLDVMNADRLSKSLENEV